MTAFTRQLHLGYGHVRQTPAFTRRGVGLAAVQPHGYGRGCGQAIAKEG
jgi:hypothetical protein